MSLFGHFKRKRKKKDRSPEDPPRADETAPGLKAIKTLWDIEPKKPQERIRGEVETDIYATQRAHRIPRRKPPRRPRAIPDESEGNSF